MTDEKTEAIGVKSQWVLLCLPNRAMTLICYSGCSARHLRHRLTRPIYPPACLPRALCCTSKGHESLLWRGMPPTVFHVLLNLGACIAPKRSTFKID